VIDRGTIVVRDGAIDEVGADVEVPSDARLWNVDGKWVYPGLVDAYSPVSIEDESPGRGDTYWSQLIQPQRDASRHYRVDQSLNETLRSQGVTCRLVVPDSGIIRGTSVLVTTGDVPAGQAMVKDRVALHVRLSTDPKLRDRQYPRSPMGAVALARQAMYDADWYDKAWEVYRSDSGVERPERNEALERLHEYLEGDRLVIIDAPDEQYFLRAYEFVREFGLRAVIRGSGLEYRRLETIRATGLPVIVPVEFPKRPNVATPETALEVSLEQLMHWDIAPENPARLVKAGVPAALTSFGLPGHAEFLNAVRAAVERGLDAADALSALTVEPAGLFGVSDRLGTLEAGKAAHLVVTDGDLFGSDTKVLATWVDGQRCEIVQPPVIDVRGTWRVKPRGRRAKRFFLTVSGKPGKLDGSVRLGREKEEETKLKAVGIRDARFACTFDGKLMGRHGVVQLSAVLSATGGGKIDWVGGMQWPDGTQAPIRVERVDMETLKETAEDSDGDEQGEDGSNDAGTRAASFPVNYPLGAFGREEAPQQPPLVVFQGATVWTCEDEGPVENVSVMIGSGKIVALGPDLIAPPGAVVVDCSGKHITPGVIDCHSHMATDGGVNESGQAISAEVRIADFLDANDIAIYRQLAGGVTASHVLHGSSNPIGGQNQLIKLRWGALPDELKFEKAPPTIKFALGENVKQSNVREPTGRYPQTRMGVVEIMRDALLAAREYGLRLQEWRRTRRGTPPRRDLELDALVEVLRHDRMVHCHAYRQDEVIAFLRLMEEFDVQAAALHHILEGYKVADVMAQHGVAGSAFSDWWAYKFEVYDSIPYNGALMHRAGVLVSFNSDSRELARHLNQEAAKAVKYGGVSPHEALKFVTLNPAKQLGVDRYVGSLEPGKHADLVVWSGPPLSNFSRCEQTWIDGRKYFDLEGDRKMRRQAQTRRQALVQKILGSGQTTHDSERKDK
jgi:N-acetylglucosamine-6-phosphate deacetylase